MRKVFANQWFILAAILTITFSAFSFATYQKVSTVTSTDQCFQKPCKSTEKGEFFWDFLRSRLPSVSFQ
jgi:hypothetical protein